MAFTDNGIERLHLLLRGVSSVYPAYLGFASGSADFNGTETNLTNEVIRKAVSWGSTGDNSLYTVELSSLEANGSDINTVGLFDISAVGSGELFTYDDSFIGTKNNTFNVQIEGEIVIRRP